MGSAASSMRGLDIRQPMQPAVDDPGGRSAAPQTPAERGRTPSDPAGAASTIDSMIRRMRSGPPTERSRRRVAAERARAEREAREGGSLMADAISTEWVIPWITRRYEASRFPVDPFFELDEKRLRSLQNEWALDDDQVMRLAGEAASEDHLQLMVRQFNEVNSARERLAARGYAGVLAQLAAAVTDPAALTLDAVTWGATAPFTRGTKATRLAHAWRAGIAAGASNAAVEGYLASVDDTRGLGDVILAATGGLAIGGGLGAAFGPALQSRLDKAMASVRRQILTRELAEGGVLEVTEKGRRLGFTPEATIQEKRDVVSALMLAENARLAGVPGSRPMFSADEMSGEALDEVVGRFSDEAIDLADRFGDGRRIGDSAYDASRVDENIPRSRYGKFRFGIAGRLGQSESPLMRRVGAMLVEDALPRINPDGSIRAVDEPATVWVRRMQQREMAEFNRAALPAFEEWKRVNNKTSNPVNHFDLLDEFFTEVGLAVRRGGALELNQADPVNRMAAQFSRQMNRLREVGARYGVKGFDELAEDPMYFSRMPSGQKIQQLIRKAGTKADGTFDPKLGTQEVERMIAEARRGAEMRAARRRGEDFDAERFSEENLLAFARGYLRMIDTGDEQGRYLQFAELFSGRLGERGEAMMREAGFSKADIERLRATMEEDLADRAAQRTAEKGAPAAGRRRTLLDEDTEYTAANGAVLTMDDLYERNAVRVMEIYSRQLYGAAAGRNIMDAVAEQTGENIESFDDLLRVIETDALDRGLDAKGKAKLRRDLKRLDAGWRSMMNWRQESVLDAETARIVQELRSYNFIRLMGQMGFAQIAEVGTVLAEVGMSAMMQQMPALRQLYRRAKTGELSNEYLASLEQITGLGTHRLNGRVISRLDQTDPGFELQGGRIRRSMERGRHLVADVSVLNAINQALYRSFIMAQPQRWYLMAVGKAAKPSDARLALIGMTRERFDAMLAQIREHAVTHNGELGGRITDLRMDRWDRATLEDFSSTLHRIGTRVVQENDIGQMAVWMNGDLGKTLMQFKSFITAAYEKQLLAGVATRDFDVFAAFSYSTMLAGMAYMAQQSIVAAGRSDREEVIEERLSVKAIAAAAFSRAGYASIIPGTIDTGLTLLGLDKQFDFGRSSGLASDFFGGNAVVDSIDKAARVPASIRAMIEAGQLTEDEVRKIRSTLPFQNAMGVSSILDAIGAGAAVDDELVQE